MANHILVIDDQESMQSIISQMLKDKGYQVSTASDGEEGLNLLNQNPDSFDLVLADVNMPKIDGFEFLKTVKNTHPQKPVILMTGVNKDAAKVLGEEYQADAVIEKPFKVEEVLAVIRRIMEGKKITKEMTVAEALRVKPVIIPILMSKGMHCLGCVIAQGETVAQAAEVHGLDAEQLVKELNEV